jgi:predicted acyltransferase
VTELLYRFWPVEGFNQAFVPDQNFGAWVDLKLMGTIQNDHWVAFNAVPTAAHTIWGVLAGLLLRSDRTDNQKLKILVLTGLAGVIAGLALTPISPFIKKIATSSVVIETGGFCLLFMAFAYWLVDVKKIHKIPLFFAIVGMNPIFMYFLWMVGIGPFLSRIAKPFSYALFFWSGETFMAYATSLITWFFLWYICYFFYKHKVFIKI